MCSGEWCGVHGLDPCECDTADRHGGGGLGVGPVPDRLTFKPGGIADRKRQRWEYATFGGVDTAIVSCPGCGDVTSLLHQDIREDGTVEQVLKCPAPGCSYRRFIRLEGWKEEESRAEGD